MKSFFLDTHGYVINTAHSVRSHFDVINLLLSFLRYANIIDLSHMRCDAMNADVYIHVDKMSRFFWKYAQSIHSVHFPFVLQEFDGILEIKYEDHIIDSKTVAIMESLFDNSEKTLYVLDDMWTFFYDNMESYDIANDNVNFYWRLFVYLITFETGYVRYDYDEEHMDVKKHPLHHLDIFFSTKNTFKIGVNNRLNLEEFRKILDIQEICSKLY